MPSEFDDVVRDDRRDQLAPQGVLGQQVPEPLDHDVGGKYAAQVVLEVRVVGERASRAAAVVRLLLGVREQHRELGPRHPARRRAARSAISSLDGSTSSRPVEQPLRLEPHHQVLVRLHAVSGGAASCERICACR